MGKRLRMAPSADCLQQPLRTGLNKLRLSGPRFQLRLPLVLSLSKDSHEDSK